MRSKVLFLLLFFLTPVAAFAAPQVIGGVEIDYPFRLTPSPGYPNPSSAREKDGKEAGTSSIVFYEPPWICSGFSSNPYSVSFAIAKFSKDNKSDLEQTFRKIAALFTAPNEGTTVLDSATRSR